MKTVAVIVARGGSKGIPLKNLQTVGGSPMLSRAIAACYDCGPGVLDKVVVSTDSGSIAHVARFGGAEVVDRPEDISGDHARIEDAVRHAIKKSYPTQLPDAVAIIQPNIPVWKPGIIEQVLGELEFGECTAVATACLAKERPEWLTRLDEQRYASLYMQRELKEAQRQELPDLYHQDGQIVAVKLDTFMLPSPKCYLGYVGPKLRLVVKDAIYGVDIDEPWEISVAEAALAWLEKKSAPKN